MKIAFSYLFKYKCGRIFGDTRMALRGYRIVEYVKNQKQNKKYYDGILINVVLFSIYKNI